MELKLRVWRFVKIAFDSWIFFESINHQNGDEIISMKINPAEIVRFVFRKRDIEIKIFGGDEMECSIESKTFGADEMAKKRKSASPSESLRMFDDACCNLW